MDNEKRNLLDVLKTELAFLEKGGYSGSARQPVEMPALFRRFANLRKLRRERSLRAVQRMCLDAGGTSAIARREDSMPPYSPQRAGGDAGLTLPIRGST